MKSKFREKEKIEVGISTGFKVTVTEEQIKSFADLTGDMHPLHTDRDYAVQNGFKNVIAHGALITSFASRLIGMDLPGLQSIVLSQDSQYKHPVYPGDEIEFAGVVTKVRKSLAIVYISISVTNQDNIEVGDINFTVKLRN